LSALSKSRDEGMANADGRGSALGGCADLKHLPCRWPQMGRWGDEGMGGLNFKYIVNLKLKTQNSKLLFDIL